MVMKNKLGITNSAELARVEEKITKKAAKQLYDQGDISKVEVGTFTGLAAIHKYLFKDIYEFAGEIRQVNLAKDNFAFAPVMYLRPALAYIDKLPQTTFDEIIEKYVIRKCIIDGIIIGFIIVIIIYFIIYFSAKCIRKYFR